MDHFVEKIAEHTMQKWLANQQLHDRANSGRPGQLGPYITLSRETGAGGTEIAKRLAKKMGWDLLDQELLEHLADEYHLDHKLLKELDETKRSWFADTLSAWLVGNGYTQLSYVHRLGKMLMVAAHHGRFVAVGRGARFILPREHGLSVRIIAPLDFRIGETMLRRGISADEARKQVTDSDNAREAFVNEYFQHKSADPHMYDLVINVEKVTQADAVDLIEKLATSWMIKRGFELS